MKKLRYGPMALAIVVGVGAFIGAQRLELIPGPWSNNKTVSQAFYTAPRTLENYSSAIADSPDNYMTYYRRGMEFQQRRQYEKALADLDAAVRLSPIPLAVAALGNRASDTTHAATRTLNLVVLIRTTRAELLQQLNRPEEALADLDQALAFDARKNNVQHARAVLRAVTGRYDDAITDFDVMLERRDNAEWYFQRGITKYLKGDWPGAAVDFGQATRMSPREDNYFIWLAKAHLRAGRPMDPQQFASVAPNGSARYVIEALLSDYNTAQFIAGARAGSAYAGRNARNARCETSLFIGEWLLVRKKGEGAAEMFQETLAACRPLSFESAVATAELRRLSSY